MQKSRLLKIIKSLSPEEMDALSSFLSTDYLLEDQYTESRKLFQLLKECYPSLDQPQLEKKAVYQFIYGSSEWISGKLDKLMSHFLKLVYQFISVHFSKAYQNPQITVCAFLQKRGLRSIFQREYNKLNKLLDTPNFYDSTILYEHFLLRELLVKEQALVINSKIDLELPDMLESLDQFYILTKLKYACQLLAIDFFILPVSKGNSLKALDHMEKLIALPHLQLPVIQVYYQAFRMLDAEVNFQTENFLKFQTLLNQLDSHLSLDQQKSLHTLIRNYAIFQYHNGHKPYLRKAFDIYRDHYNRGFLYHKDKILAQPFLNIVTFGLRLCEYDWVYQFIVDHKNKIKSAEDSVLVYNLNLAMYYFYTNDYDQSLAILPTNFSETYYKICAKRLELIIYSETDLEILDARIDAFKIFIYRIPKSKITPKQQRANNNFIHLLKQIRHPKTAFNNARIEKLLAKIQTLDHIAEKQWLVEKLEEMRS